MDETTAALRKIYEDSLLEAESKVKYYRRLLGKLRACEGVKPEVEGNADCAEEPQKGELVFKCDSGVVRITPFFKDDGSKARLAEVELELRPRVRQHEDVVCPRICSECQCMELRNNLKQQKSENEVLHRKVNDLGHKFRRAKHEGEALRAKLRQACRERDELAEKLRIAEADDQKRSLLLETLNQLFEGESPRASEASFDEKR